MIRRKAFLLTICLLAFIVSFSVSSQRRLGNFSDGGVYVGGTVWGGTLNQRRSDVMGRLDYNSLYQAKQNGAINAIQLVASNKWRGDLNTHLENLRDWLEKNQECLPLIDILFFSEEHPYDAGAYLDVLYEEVKKFDSSLPVYVWPSYPLGPIGSKYDGWVYDAYGPKYSDFRNKFVASFLKTGKPLVMCIDGSGCVEGSDINSVREQIAVCYEFDIPAFYFIADSPSGGLSTWYSGLKVVLVPWRNFVFSSLEFQNRCKGTEPLKSADFLWGEPIELTGDYDDNISYTWNGFGDATVYGFTRLNVMDDNTLQSDGREVALDYQFWSLLPVEDAELILHGVNKNDIRVQKARYGRFDEWHDVEITFAGNDKVCFWLGDVGQEFRIRVTMLGGSPVTFKGGCISGYVGQTAKALDLNYFWDGWRKQYKADIDLTRGIWRTLAEVDRPDLLEPNGLALRGRNGSRVKVEVVQKVTCMDSINDLVVTLRGRGNKPNLGGSFELGVSRDGKNIIAKESSVGKPVDGNGTFVGTLELDLSENPQFQGVREFYIHMIQENSSGVRASVSSSLSELTITARRQSN